MRLDANVFTAANCQARRVHFSFFAAVAKNSFIRLRLIFLSRIFYDSELTRLLREKLTNRAILCQVKFELVAMAAYVWFTECC